MLSAQEKHQFVRDGYVVRQLDFKEELFEAAHDLAWDHIEPHFVRGKPKTWFGDIKDSCRVATIAKRRGRVKVREECVRQEQWLVDMVFGNEEITGIIKDLLGPKGAPRKKIRGLYPIFPSPTSSDTLNGGMDAHPFQICCIIYMSDVVENGGAFNLWKGSHRIMQNAFPGKASWQMMGNVKELAKQAENECERISLPGKKGTALIWHHRLLHTPGTNRTKKVRHALVADFLQRDWESKAEMPHEEDMWADWAVGA